MGTGPFSSSPRRQKLRRADLEDLLAGVHLLGGGGGGSAWGLRSLLDVCGWPIGLHDLDALDPATPCIAVGIGGSTMMVSERLPGESPFEAAIQAVERWTGRRAEAVCTMEIAGVNGLLSLTLAGERRLLDADLMGRGLPGIDQLAPLVDEVPGLVLACGMGDPGVLLMADPRPAEAESVLRAAFMGAGGWAAVVVGGLTVGILRDHAIPGSVTRALDLGRLWRTARRIDAPLARSMGGRLLVNGRIDGIHYDHQDMRTRTIDVWGHGGEVVRVIAASEFLAVVVDGRVEAIPPDIIVLADVVTSEILMADQVGVGRTVSVLALPAPPFWSALPARRAAVGSAHAGLGPMQKDAS